MRRQTSYIFGIALFFSLWMSSVFAQTAAIQGHSFLGGVSATTQGLNSTNYLNGIIPSATITVYLTGTQTLATIYKDGNNTPLSNPFTSNTVGSVNPGGYIFWAAINQGYDVVMSGGIAPNTYPQPVTLTDVYPGFEFNGGGGCSTGGIPTTNGSVTGDITSTNCGADNRIGDTAAVPANTQTFGYENLIDNYSDNAIGIGHNNGYQSAASEFIGLGDTNFSGGTLSNGSNIIGIGNDNFDTPNGFNGHFSDGIAIGDMNAQGVDVGTHSTNGIVAIGDDNYSYEFNQSTTIGIGLANAGYLGNGNEVVAIGDSNAVGENHTSPYNLVYDVTAIGDNNAAVLGNSLNDIVAVGDGGAGTIPDNSHDIVAIGDGVDKQCGTFTGCSGIPNPVTTNDVVAIGDVAASFNQGNDIVAIGDSALGSNTRGAGDGFYNSGNFNLAIGSYTLVANSTGENNVAIGAYAGADGFVSPETWGNSNHTGSNNTWIGYDSGPNTTTQLSNTIALGYQAHNDASNQIVLGNTSVTQFRVPAVKAASGTDCLQVDATGNITNTGSACGSGGGGSGTVTTVSVASANGFAGTVANPTTTPAITLSTTASGPLKGNGTAISAAAYADIVGLWASGSCSGFLKSDGTCATPSGGISGSGTSGYLPAWTSASAIGNSHIDDGVTTSGTITSTEPIAVTVTGGAGGAFDATEGTAPSATSGHDILYADSTNHCMEYSANGGSFSCLGSSSSGFPITLGSTSIAASSTTTTIAGLTLTSPTLTTPALGTPASGVATNITGLVPGNLVAGSVAAQLTFPGGDNFNGGVNAQTGTTYTMVAGDENKTLTLSNASAVAVTLPQATTAGFTTGAFFHVVNLGAGTVTITPTTSTINGATTLALTTDQGADIYSDGTNYTANLGAASGGGGSSAFSSITSGTNTSAAMVVGSGASLTTDGGTYFQGGVNAQTGTSYTVVASDENKVVTFSNTASVAVTLPVATTTGFGAGAVFTFTNLGLGIVTVTPTTSHINGSASIALVQNESAEIYSDGTNYFGYFPAHNIHVTVPYLGIETGWETSDSGTGAYIAQAISASGYPYLAMYANGGGSNNVLSFHTTSGSFQATLAGTGVWGWNSKTGGLGIYTSPPDTGLSRDSTLGAGNVDVGNGFSGDKSGTLNAANLNASALVTAAAYGQSAASSTGGTCSMSSATSCTLTIGHTYTTPVCIATAQGTDVTGGAAACSVSGTTVTITAATSNSDTWGAFVFGNPN